MTSQRTTASAQFQLPLPNLSHHEVASRCLHSVRQAHPTSGLNPTQSLQLPRKTRLMPINLPPSSTSYLEPLLVVLRILREDCAAKNSTSTHIALLLRQFFVSPHEKNLQVLGAVCPRGRLENHLCSAERRFLIKSFRLANGFRFTLTCVDEIAYRHSTADLDSSIHERKFVSCCEEG